MLTKLQDQSSGPSNRIKIDLLIRNAWILTLDDNRTEYNPGFVAIKDKRILSVGELGNCSNFAAKKEIDGTDCLVLPGLVNTHTHAAMTPFRGYADDMKLQEWLFNHIFPAESKYINKNSVYWGTKLAIAEMIRNGITTFADGYFFVGAVAKAVKDCGIRAVVGQGILDYPTPDAPDPKNNFTTAQNFIESYSSFSDRVYPSIFCHSPYTCGEQTLIRMKELTSCCNALYQIHLSETKNEVKEFEDKHHTRPALHLEDIGVLDDLTLVAHAVWVNEKEIEVLSKHGVGISHVVSSNMKLAAGVAPLGQFLDAELKVGLGTDGCASNNRLDLLRDADLSAKLHKVWRGDPMVVPAVSMVEIITRRGAQAIGLGHEIGSIEKGKVADIIVVELHKPHLTPLYDPYSHLVYSAKGSDVRDVVIAGEVVMRDREILTFDEREVIGEVRSISNKIRSQQI